MAAIFHQYTGNSILKNSVGPMAVPITTDLFAGLVNARFMCILTQISVTTTDTVQFFMTFDDFIHHYYFGKGVGSISISGALFSDCDTFLPGLSRFYGAIGGRRGKRVKVSLQSFGFEGVLLDCNVTITAEPETMASFTANFGMVNHTLPSPEVVQSAC